MKQFYYFFAVISPPLTNRGSVIHWSTKSTRLLLFDRRGARNNMCWFRLPKNQAQDLRSKASFVRTRIHLERCHFSRPPFFSFLFSRFQALCILFYVFIISLMSHDVSLQFLDAVKKPPRLVLL